MKLMIFWGLLSCTYTVTASSFWHNTAEGWWWYAQEPEPQKLEKPKEKKKPIVIAENKQEKKEDSSKKVTQSAISSASSSAPMFSADWVKENLEVYRKVAWDNPTIENLRAYMYLQRFAIDRSEQFAYAGQMAVEGDPFLDETARSPLGGTINVQRSSFINAEQSHLLKKLYQKVGVFFIFKNDCYLCAEQAKILKTASNLYDITVKAVSLDMPSPTNEVVKLFPDYIVNANPNFTAKLELKALPSTFLLDAETQEIKPLVQGFLTLSDLNRRAINVANKNKWLPQEDFNRVKPFDDLTSLASVLSPNSELAKKYKGKQGINPYGKDTGYIDPAILVKEIRALKEKSLGKDYQPRGY